MKIFLRVMPGAKEEKIEKQGEKMFKIWVREPAKQGKANKAVVRVFAKYLKVPISYIDIISGYASRDKIIEIYE